MSILSLHLYIYKNMINLILDGSNYSLNFVMFISTEQTIVSCQSVKPHLLIMTTMILWMNDIDF